MDFKNSLVNKHGNGLWLLLAQEYFICGTGQQYFQVRMVSCPDACFEDTWLLFENLQVTWKRDNSRNLCSQAGCFLPALIERSITFPG